MGRKFKGSQGVWFISGFTEIVSMPYQVKISKVSGSDYEEAKANAKLISKAPEMLEKLTEIITALEHKTFKVHENYFKQTIEQLIKESL